MMLPTATYRLQLREGVTFRAVEERLGYIAGLGISHLYLSPVFTATSGSTHGYDVTDPAEVDPVLGGKEGFSRLAERARSHGLGIILDIVPNHTAFSTENPWLADVLRHGEASRYARHFDIDWSKGRLILPFLPEPFETMASAGHLRIKDGALCWEGGAVPLAPGTEGGEDVRTVHEMQPWRLTQWEYGRDGITHRRFFNVTDLIGMRVEDDAVFEDTHALLFELIDAGEVQGLRIDHVDGLSDPAAYLHRLRHRVGDLPIWVEKILTSDETLPAWPVEGTTGYEAAAAIVRLLTDGDGLAEIDAAWREATGREGSFDDALRAAKGLVMRQELAAELHQLIALARSALEAEGQHDAGDEALREAMLGLLVAFPCYRTYFDDEDSNPSDLRLMEAVAAEAAADLRTDATVQAIRHSIADGKNQESLALRVRFQQVTGALLAKAHEDTAGFRWNRYLAMNEVGATPDDPPLPADAFSAWLARRSASGLTLTSSHDSKRAEDARMRLVAISHAPAAFQRVWRASHLIPGADGIDPNLRWYTVQSFLAMWEDGRDDLAERLTAHIEKAMREAKEVTSWTHPVPETEAPAQAFAGALASAWADALPDGAEDIIRLGETLSLIQLALKMLMPGIPDIYRGCEGPAFYLTDPDNRRFIDFETLIRLPDGDGFGAVKARLTRALLALRRAEADFFVTAKTRFHSPARGLMRLERTADAGRLTLTFSLDGAGVSGGSIWPGADAGGSALAVDWLPGPTHSQPHP